MGDWRTLPHSDLPGSDATNQQSISGWASRRANLAESLHSLKAIPHPARCAEAVQLDIRFANRFILPARFARALVHQQPNGVEMIRQCADPTPDERRHPM